MKNERRLSGRRVLLLISFIRTFFNIFRLEISLETMEVDQINQKQRNEQHPLFVCLCLCVSGPYIRHKSVFRLPLRQIHHAIENKRNIRACKILPSTVTSRNFQILICYTSVLANLWKFREQLRLIQLIVLLKLKKLLQDCHRFSTYYDNLIRQTSLIIR